METKKLSLLLCAAGMGSLKKAAEKFNYTQSGIIYLINSLEKELGLRILHRTVEGITFTPEGKILEPYIRNIVRCEEELIDKLREINDGTTEKLRIASWPIYAGYYLPVAIRNYVKDHPKNSINVRVGMMPEFEKLLKEDEVDLIIGSPTNMRKTRWIHLMDYEVYVAVPASAPFYDDQSVSFEDIKGYPLIFSDYNNISEIIVQQFDLDYVNKLEVSSCDGLSLLRMVAEGLGIAFLSEMYLSECPDSVRMLPMEPPVMRKIGITINEKKAEDPLIKSFIPYIYDFHEKNRGQKK